MTDAQIGGVLARAIGELAAGGASAQTIVAALLSAAADIAAEAVGADDATGTAMAMAAGAAMLDVAMAAEAQS